MTAMNIDTLYEETIKKLKEGRRPQIKLDPKLIGELNESYLGLLKDPSKHSAQALERLLCILDNTANTSYVFKEAIIQTLNTSWANNQIYVYALSVSQKHICDDCFKTGQMIPFEFFESLRALIKHNDPEIREWTLRTITSLGPLSLRLKNDVLNARPNFFQKFNAQQKACSQLIEYLENEWSRIKL